MAYNATKFGRVYARKQSSFSSVFDVAGVKAGQIIECDVSIPPSTREIFERAATKGGFFELPPVVGSQYGAEFSISMPLHGMSASAPTSNFGAAHPEGELLAAVLGGNSIFNFMPASQGIQSGSSATAINVTDGDHVYFKAGGAVAAEVNASTGACDLSFIKSRDSSGDPDVINLALALSGPPTVSKAVYGSNTIYLSKDATSAFSFLWQGQEANTQVLLNSCVPTSATITIGPKNNFPTLEVTFVCNKISADNTSAAALADFAFSFPVLPVPMASNSGRFVYATTSGGTGATDLDVDSLTITMAQEIVPQLAHGAVGGVRDVLVTNRSVEVAFSGIMGASNPFNTTGTPIFDIAGTNDAPKALMLQVGSPGNMFGMFMGSPVYMAPPEISDMGGVYGFNFVAKPGNYTADTDDSLSSMPDTDFRLAFL